LPLRQGREVVTTLTDLLIGWGSVNALVVLVPLAVAHRRHSHVRRTPTNDTAVADRVQWAQRHEWQ
jgi:hypothetical protein